MTEQEFTEKHKCTTGWIGNKGVWRNGFIVGAILVWMILMLFILLSYSS